MSEPRLAAAAIIMSSDATPQVLLARRNDALRFMGGHHVFPGGSVDGGDRALAATLFNRDDDEAASIVAAARETFEETGLLLTTGPAPSDSARQAARDDLAEGTISFSRVLESLGQRIDRDHFVPAGYWVTPPISPIRFATRFFLVQCQDSYGGQCCGGEITGLDWLTPTDARAAWRGGSIRLSVPVAYVLRHLARNAYPAVLSALRDTRGREAGESALFETRCGIALVPLRTATIPPATHTNAVLVGEDELLLIDPGADESDEIALLDRQLELALESGSRLAAVVLTHGHPDHIGAVEHVSKRYGAPVWAHASVADRLAVPVSRKLNDGDVLEAAGAPPWRLRAIHTPGHDPGHLAFLEETTGTLLAGDMIANPGTIVVSLEYGGDMSEYLNSIDRLLSESFHILVPAHGLPMGSPKERLRELKAHRLDRESKVQVAWDQGAREEEALLRAVYADTDQSAWPLARHSLRAHLKRLGLAAKNMETD